MLVEGLLDCLCRDDVVGDAVEDPVEGPVDCVSRDDVVGDVVDSVSRRSSRLFM